MKFVDSFPTTVTGKIQKFKIREQAIIDTRLVGCRGHRNGMKPKLSRLFAKRPLGWSVLSALNAQPFELFGDCRKPFTLSFCQDFLGPRKFLSPLVGVPDRKFGEEVAAWVKLRAGATVTEDEIRDFCRTRLAHFKTPRYVKFVESFPTTVTGKIQKFKIREQAILDLGLQDVAAIETA